MFFCDLPFWKCAKRHKLHVESLVLSVPFCCKNVKCVRNSGVLSKICRRVKWASNSGSFCENQLSWQPCSQQLDETFSAKFQMQEIKTCKIQTFLVLPKLQTFSDIHLLLQCYFLQNSFNSIRTTLCFRTGHVWQTVQVIHQILIIL